jgi:hypothetical protein
VLHRGKPLDVPTSPRQRRAAAADLIDDEHLWDIAIGEPGPAAWANTRGVSVIRFFRYGTVYEDSRVFIAGTELRFVEPSISRGNDEDRAQAHP